MEHGAWSMEHGVWSMNYEILIMKCKRFEGNAAHWVPLLLLDAAGMQYKVYNQVGGNKAPLLLLDAAGMQYKVYDQVEGNKAPLLLLDAAARIATMLLLLRCYCYTMCTMYDILILIMSIYTY